MMQRQTWQLGSGVMQNPPIQSASFSEAGYPGSSHTNMYTVHGKLPADQLPAYSNVSPEPVVESSPELLCTQTTSRQYKSIEPMLSHSAESLMQKRGRFINNNQDKLHSFVTDFLPTVLENEQPKSTIDTVEDTKIENVEFQYDNLSSGTSDSPIGHYKNSSSHSHNVPEDSDEMDLLSMFDLGNWWEEMVDRYSEQPTVPLSIEGLCALELPLPQTVNVQDCGSSEHLKEESEPNLFASEAPEYMLFKESTVTPDMEQIGKKTDLLEYLLQPSQVHQVQPPCGQSLPIVEGVGFPAPLQPEHNAPRKRGRPQKDFTGDANQIVKVPEGFGTNILPEGHPVPLSRPARGAKLECKRKMRTTSVFEENAPSPSSDQEYIPQLINLLPNKKPRGSPSKCLGSLKDSSNEKKIKNRNNNEASKKSREKKKEAERQRVIECEKLELRNEKLKKRCARLHAAFEIIIQNVNLAPGVVLPISD